MPSSPRVGAPFCVSCQFARRPSTAELERDARGLTFDTLIGWVGLTELVEGIPALKSHQCAHDLGRSTCLIRPSAQDHSTPARFRGDRENRQGPETNQGKRPAGQASFGVYYLVRLYSPDSPLGESGGQPRTVGVLPGPLASDLAGSCLALRALTSLGLVWPLWPLTTLGLVWPSGF